MEVGEEGEYIPIATLSPPEWPAIRWAAMRESFCWLKWCLMSSDVSWHIRDKLWPMPKHGSIILSTETRMLVRTDSHLDSHTTLRLLAFVLPHSLLFSWMGSLQPVRLRIFLKGPLAVQWIGYGPVTILRVLQYKWYLLDVVGQRLHSELCQSVRALFSIR